MMRIPDLGELERERQKRFENHKKRTEELLKKLSKPQPVKRQTCVNCKNFERSTEDSGFCKLHEKQVSIFDYCIYFEKS